MSENTRGDEWGDLQTWNIVRVVLGNQAIIMRSLALLFSTLPESEGSSAEIILCDRADKTEQLAERLGK